MKRIVLAILSIIALISTGDAQSLRDASGYTIIAQGVSAPGWTAVATDGSNFSMENISTDFLLIGFVEPGCEMCRALLPGLSELQEAYRKNLTVVLLSVGTSSADWEEWVHEYGSVLRMAHATKAVSDSYKVEATPTLYLLDNNRKVASTRLVRVEDVQTMLNEKIR